MTVRFLKLTGEDVVDLHPAIVEFNKGAGKRAGLEVSEPMPWGEVRKHTWRQIAAKDTYAHCGPDGENMSDDDMFDFWLGDGGTRSASTSTGTKGELLDVMSKAADGLLLPPGHNWHVPGPRYEADTCDGYVMRNDTIICRGSCRTIAFWEADEKVWKVDRNRIAMRGVMPTCAEEKFALAEDLETRIALAEADAENDLNETVYELAEIVESMHPEDEKEHLWTGVNFTIAANAIVRVLTALPAVLQKHDHRSWPPSGSYFDTLELNNGPAIEGVRVAGQGRFQLVVCANREVWSIDFTSAGPVGTRFNPTVLRVGGNHDHGGTIDPGYDRWYAMPTATDVLATVAAPPFKSLLCPRTLNQVKRALDAMGRTADVKAS